MKKLFLVAGCLLLSWSASALEIVGVKVPEKAQVGEHTLLLNGAGARAMVSIFNVYVIALYLPERKHSVEEVLALETSKRVTLDFLYGVTSVQLLEATHKLISENVSAEEVKSLDASWKVFAAQFDKIKDINKGDQLVLDYQPATGTRTSLNGKELGSVAEGKFIRAFLMVWLGQNPAQSDLKVKLLGADSADAKR